jgi:hypothetical protein
VIFALVYLLLRRLARMTAISPNEVLDTEVELVVLRHQLKVLKRKVAAHAFAVATGCSWPRLAGSSLGLGGRRSWSAPKRCFAGTGSYRS